MIGIYFFLTVLCTESIGITHVFGLYVLLMVNINDIIVNDNVV